MAKIVRRTITHKYLPIKPDFLTVETEIPFDCYIKRFDDYLIIIEAGTVLNKELLEKIYLHSTIYVLKQDMDIVKEYYLSHKKDDSNNHALGIYKNEVFANASKLDEALSGVDDYDTWLNIIYSKTSELMGVIFNGREEDIQIEPIRSCAIAIVEYVKADRKAMHSVIKMMADEYSSHHHSTNVAFLSAILSDAIGLLNEEITDITVAGLLHDIGKIRIDPVVLNKPASLNEEEYALMKRHSEDGYTILVKNGVENSTVLQGVRYHHENLDGSGYPCGMKGKEIPKAALIIGLCDVFDALTTKRTFRNNYTTFEALLLMKREMNNQFDEHYIDAFIRLLR
jgi:HD-GYP domain-containing protein (c-di-GMP phosphodiesterase class II)